MTLQAAYKQFLTAPNTRFLAEDASLHYITTLITVKGASEIVKHFNIQSHDLNKKEELFLDVVEGEGAIAIEAHTTLEFVNGGGSYLPKLDDNFLADRIVTFPVVHIVTFNAAGQIQQIRQSWDQGSLLKLIDVIGKTGRNWPIRDGTDQIKLIVSSVASSGKTSIGSKQAPASRSRENSNNVTRDPHASLALFAPRDKPQNDSLPAVAAPRASAKPPPRDYHDLFVGNESDNSPTIASRGINIAGDGMGSRKVVQSFDSPARPAGIAPKGGAGRNYAPSRLFDHHTEADDVDSPQRPASDKNHAAEHLYKPNAKKYTHFDFGDGSDPQDRPAPTPLKDVKSKHGSNWGFDDFNTPAKFVPGKVSRPNDTPHWGNSDDEVVDSPIKIKRADKPRKDAETHFQFEDDGNPPHERIIGRPRGDGGNTGMGLYKNNLYDDEQGGQAGGSEQKQVRTLANTKVRGKDFDSQFEMVDDSPSVKSQGPVGDDRAKAIKMMDANWSSYDQSPSQKENKSQPTPASPTTLSKGINIAGDGMGSRKVVGPLSETTNSNAPKGISIGGDGMGGKKGAGRQWGFGDDSDAEDDNKPAYRTGKTQGKNQVTGGDFWDF